MSDVQTLREVLVLEYRALTQLDIWVNNITPGSRIRLNTRSIFLLPLSGLGRGLQWIHLATTLNR